MQEIFVIHAMILLYMVINFWKLPLLIDYGNFQYNREDNIFVTKKYERYKFVYMFTTSEPTALLVF